MLCNIADLFVEIPEAGGLSPRCGAYQADNKNVDITIDENRYVYDRLNYSSPFDAAYMESGTQFYSRLLQFNGMMLHASAVALDGKAYLFSGPCGVGKSTHTKLWQQVFGSAAQIFNDDKPALRCLDGRWFAYGTPWCGKDGININMKVPLAGICFLKRGEENVIRRLTPQQAMSCVISQTIRRFKNASNLDLMLGLVDRLVRDIPVYELYSRPVPEAARLSYETMRQGAEEVLL